jgi:hypothetical protein
MNFEQASGGGVNYFVTQSYFEIRNGREANKTAPRATIVLTV